MLCNCCRVLKFLSCLCCCIFTCRSLTNRLQTLELFTVNTVMDSGNISVNLSADSQAILPEPFPLAVVVLYGIGGDCVIEELNFNVSIDEIFSPGKGIYFSLQRIVLFHSMCIMHSISAVNLIIKLKPAN